MTAVLLGQHEPSTPEWHQLRATGIGASEIAAVVGLSPYESPFGLWHKKKGNIAGQAETGAMRWGHLLEPVIAAAFAEAHPEYLVAVAGTYAHSGRRWQMANVDRLLFPEGDPFPGNEPVSLLEIKTSRYGDGFGRSGSDQIPIHYRAQVMQQMDVFGFQSCYLAVLIGGNDYREYVIDYDAEDAAALREAGAAFWQSIEADDVPPLDASHHTYEVVRELHPEINGEDIELDPELHARYLATKAAADQTAAAHRLAKTEVLAAIGEARRALVNNTPVLRRQPSRNGVALYTVKESA